MGIKVIFNILTKSRFIHPKIIIIIIVKNLGSRRRRKKGCNLKSRKTKRKGQDSRYSFLNYTDV